MKASYSKYRIRWWNIIIGIASLVFVVIVVLPFFIPSLENSYLGNIIAEFWGVPLGALAAWIYFNRFRSERFRSVLPEYSKGIYRLSVLAYELQNFRKDAAAAKLKLNDQIRNDLKSGADKLMRKIVFYNRFLEFDELKNMEMCYDSAIALSELDNTLPDYEFMELYCKYLCDLYLYSLNVSNRSVNDVIYLGIVESYRYWLELKIKCT